MASSITDIAPEIMKKNLSTSAPLPSQTAPAVTAPAATVQGDTASNRIWLDNAQITETETDAEGGRQIRSALISGWAIGPEPFARIEVFIGQTRITTASIGKYRPDVATLYPQYPHA